MRCPASSVSGTFCSTSSTATPSRRSTSMISRICDTMRGISPSVGSSSRMIFGSSIIARAIARAMMLEPKIILLDEPTEGLMPRMVSQIREIIDVLRREGVAVLLVEQNVPLTLEAGQRIYIIEKGVVRHHAPAAELRADDAPIHRYMGV